MRGVWYGMLMLNTFLLLILADAYVAGIVSAWYPIMTIGTMGLCWYAAETQSSDKKEEKDDPSNDW